MSSTDRRTDGRTDGRTDKVNPVYPPSNFVGRGILPLKFGVDIQSQTKVSPETKKIQYGSACALRIPPAASWLPIPLSHIGSKVKRRQNQSYKFKKFQIFEFWNNHYTWHTFWICLIRYANMEWIPWVLLKIQSGHDSVHRWTDGHLYCTFDISIRWS